MRTREYCRKVYLLSVVAERCSCEEAKYLEEQKRQVEKRQQEVEQQ